MNAQVLIIEDEPVVRRMLVRHLKSHDMSVAEAANAEEARMQLLRHHPELILLDLGLPDRHGLDLLTDIRENQTSTAVVVTTASRAIDDAVGALRLGAVDYLIKPYELDLLDRVIQRFVTADGRDPSFIPAPVGKAPVAARGFHRLVGRSPALQRLVADARQVVRGNPKVILLEGRSGTGKEMLARALHEESARREGPWEAINCGALPATLAENELFGHEPQAYTDARSRQLGAFERANLGTLFLDEISELSLEVQVKLLRTLDLGTVRRLGGGEVPVDCMVVTATNRSLEAAVNAGTFRDDLFWRISAVRLTLPPLAARQDDILALAEYFLAEWRTRQVTMAQKTGQTHPIPREFSLDAQTILLRYPWPGNVRELRNAVERAAIFCESTLIEPHHFPDSVRTGNPQLTHLRDARQADRFPPFAVTASPVPEPSLESLERTAIERVLAECEGNRSKAAKKLGISRYSLIRRLKKFDD